MSNIRQNSFLVSKTIRYAGLGAAFGCLFPVLATIVEFSILSQPIKLSSLWSVHAEQPLLWLIDTAPLFLGIFAGYAGSRQDALISKNADLMEKENRLREYQTTLEQRVQERTHDLERRSILLRAVAEVGRRITSLRDLSDLLQQTTQLIHENFGFYHIGIFLLDEHHEYAILAAANSEGGWRMLEKKHQLKVGETGIVGYVAGTVKPRIALDVGQDAVFFNNPDLPMTRSEMALPLEVSGRVLGVLDVQSTEAQAFTEEDVSTLQIMADQLAIAILNANLFEETQKSIEATKTIFGDLSRDAWSRLLSEQPRIGFIARPSGTIPVKSEKADSNIVKAIETGDIILGADNQTVTVPVKMRGISIGAIRMKKNDISEAWTQEETNLAITLSEQLSGALESARLYRESQQKAARESLTSEISARISSQTSRQGILHELLMELGEAFRSALVSYVIVNKGYPITNAARNNHPKTTPRRDILEILSISADGNFITTDHPANELPFEKLAAAGESVLITKSKPDSMPLILSAVRIREQVAGVIQVQSTLEKRTWTDDEILLLQAISERTALSLENTRLFEETARRADQEKAVAAITASISAATSLDEILQVTAGELGRAIGRSVSFIQLGPQKEIPPAWQEVLARLPIFGYVFDGVRVLPFTQEISSEHLSMLKSGKMVFSFMSSDRLKNTVILPVRIADQLIGVIGLEKDDPSHVWGDGEIAIAQAAASRAALSLENARLLAETTSRANRERTVADIGNKIRRTNDPQEMIRIAMTELQKALGVNRVEFVPEDQKQSTEK